MEGNLKEELYYTSRFLREENRKGRNLMGDLIVTLGITGAVAIGGVVGYILSKRREEPLISEDTEISATTETTNQTITSATERPPTTLPPPPMDTDKDGISDELELKYGTDPNKPNHLFAYALKKLPEEEALKFKDVENFDANSVSLVDLYSKLPQDKRTTLEVNEFLNKILSDNKISELEKNLFDDKFVYKTLPSIENLDWTPTRENLDKIYDINVAFTAKDDKTPIAYAELRFIPVEYYYMIEKYGMIPEDYPKVFPPDNEKVFVLNPVDGKFDSLEEKFSVNVNDIVGGREYRIVALVKDLAGNEKTMEIKTPYIRQFENFSRTDNILVLSSYYPWYNPLHWKEGYIERPILGLYNSQDKIVINKHIDWATGHGIDCFVLSWWGPYSFEDETIKIILNSDLAKDIKLAILYESLGRLRYSSVNGEISINLNDTYNRQVLVNDFDYINKNYFLHPSYMRIDEKPVIFIYLSRVFGGDMEGVINNLRSKYNVFIVADEVYWQNPKEPEVIERIKLYDGVTAYNMHTNIDWIIEDFENNVSDKYREWLEVIKTLNIYFVPSSIPGFDDREVRTGNIPIPRSIERFMKHLDIAVSNSYPTPKMILITSFNEWHENTQIEPSVNYELDYLKLLKSYLESHEKR